METTYRTRGGLVIRCALMEKELIRESYRELVVWQKSIELIDDVYAAARRFPRTEMFVLSQQMRSSALSIASNIAEGWVAEHALSTGTLFAWRGDPLSSCRRRLWSREGNNSSTTNEAQRWMRRRKKSESR